MMKGPWALGPGCIYMGQPSSWQYCAIHVHSMPAADDGVKLFGCGW
jgi:hypothetical protein